LRKSWKVARDLGVIRRLRHAHQRSESQSRRADTDSSKLRLLERIDVDDVRGLHDVQLHEVDQRGTAGKVMHGARAQEIRVETRRGLESAIGRFHHFEREWAHRVTPTRR